MLFRSRAPKLVEDLVPAKLPLGVITRVLQNLLAESVSIRDMRSIFEALAEEAGRTQDPDQLTALVRPRLGRMIAQTLCAEDGTLQVMTLDPALEKMLHGAVSQSGGGQGMVLEPGLAESLFQALRNSTTRVQDQGLSAVLVVSPAIRSWLARVVRYRVNELVVLSYSEIPDDQAVKVIYTVELEARN